MVETSVLHVSLFPLCSIIGISLDRYFFSCKVADIDGQIPMTRLSHLTDLPICTKNQVVACSPQLPKHGRFLVEVLSSC